MEYALTIANHISEGGSFMNRVIALLAFCFALLASLSLAGSAEIEASMQSDKLVYADFETVKDNQPLSNRGGPVRLFAYQESASSPSSYKGGPTANMPEVVRLRPDDPNHAITFEYQFKSPNQYAGVGVEVYGHEEKEGKAEADDLSGYKSMTVQLYVTGVTAITVEFISRGHGIKMESGYPQLMFKVNPGFNAYRVPLESASQPSWATIKVKPKDVLKKLTSVNFVASCAQCAPTKGVVVVDNIVFEK